MRKKSPKNPPAPDAAQPEIPFDVDLSNLTIGAENPAWLLALFATARRDFPPRDLAERHFIDELAFLKWRILRLHSMEQAIYHRRALSFAPQVAPGPDGVSPEPHEDFHHLASVLTRDGEGEIINTLRRMEASLHRQLCSALRMTMALRRFNPLRNPELVSRKDSAK